MLEERQKVGVGSWIPGLGPCSGLFGDERQYGIGMGLSNGGKTGKLYLANQASLDQAGARAAFNASFCLWCGLPIPSHRLRYRSPRASRPGGAVPAKDAALESRSLGALGAGSFEFP